MDKKSNCNHSPWFNLYSNYKKRYGKSIFNVNIYFSKKNKLEFMFRIDNLTMIRLKQNDLGKIKTLPIYSPYQHNFKGIF